MLDLGEWERRRGLLRDVRAAADLRHAQRGRHPASTAPDAAQMRRDLGRAEKKISSLKAENACLEAELYKRDAQSQCGQLLYMQQQQLLTQQRQQAAADKARMCSVAKSCHVASFLVLVLPGGAGQGSGPWRREWRRGWYATEVAGHASSHHRTQPGSDCAVRAAHAPICPPRSECSAGNIIGCRRGMPPPCEGMVQRWRSCVYRHSHVGSYSEIEAQGRGSLHPHATSHHTKPTIQEPIISEMRVPGT